MSARLTATENLLRTAGLPPTIAGSNITFCGWAKMVVNTGTFQTFFYWRTGGGIDAAKCFFVSDAVPNFNLYDQGFTTTGLQSPMAIGTWYFLAFVFTNTGVGTSMCDVYYAAQGAAALTTLNTAVFPVVVNGTNATEFWIGAQEGPIRPWNGSFSKARVWSAALSATEIAREWKSCAPVRQTNIADYLPLKSGGSAAVASLGTWAPTGTFTTEAEPLSDAVSAGLMAA